MTGSNWQNIDATIVAPARFAANEFQTDSITEAATKLRYCLIEGAASSVLQSSFGPGDENGPIQNLYSIPFDVEVNAVSDKIVYTSDGNFETDVLKSEKPVLVDFWAEWCGPCKMIAPLLDEAAEQYAGRLTITKLNIDENPNTPPKFGIRSIPTLMLFKNGAVQAQKLGAMSRSQLTEFLESNL